MRGISLALLAGMLTWACAGTEPRPLVVLAPDSLSTTMTQASLPWGIANSGLELIQIYEAPDQLIERFARAGAAQVLVTTEPSRMAAALADHLIVDPTPLGLGTLQIAVTADASPAAHAYQQHLLTVGANWTSAPPPTP